jgi:ABC-type dipeptide/oligopeptide/nickel transport system permease subunit
MTDARRAERAAAALAREELARRQPANLWRDTLANILRQRSAVFGLILIGLLVGVAVFADVLATHPMNEPLFTSEPGLKVRAGPCIGLLGCDGPQHIAGIDSNGRDQWSRLVHGSRTSLQIGFVTVGFAIIVGTLIGAVAGYAGGFVDNLMMRIMDVLLAFPALVLAIAIVTVLGRGLINAMLAIAIVSIPIYARVTRASVLSIKERDFVVASRALGESPGGILLRRIMPNALTPLIVQGSLGIATAVLEVAALSFLGLGQQPPNPEWGSMIGLERNQVFAAPHLVFIPGIALALTVLGFNLLGDGLRDALDPRLNR